MIDKYIPWGEENAIKREELARVTGLRDRKLREEIEDARRRGMVILNFGQGYFRTDDLDLIYKAYKIETARALSIFETRKTIRRILKKAGYPVTK